MCVCEREREREREGEGDRREREKEREREREREKHTHAEREGGRERERDDQGAPQPGNEVEGGDALRVLVVNAVLDEPVYKVGLKVGLSVYQVGFKVMPYMSWSSMLCWMNLFRL